MQCVDMLWHAFNYPGIKMVCVAPVDYYFEEFIWPTLRTIIEDSDPRIKNISVKHREYEFVNGSRWYFKAYDEPDMVRGWEAHRIWFEEFAQLARGNNEKARGIFNNCLMRLRAPGNYPYGVDATQNPAGYNFSWKIFIQNSPYKDSPVQHWVLKPGESLDNPDGAWWKEYELVKGNDVYFCMTANSGVNTTLKQDYIDTMLSEYADDPQMKKRMVDGDFNPINTLVYDYPFYIPDVHIVSRQTVLEEYRLDRTEEQDFPKWWPLLVGIDCAGTASPWAVEFYVKTPDDLYICFDEIYCKVGSWNEIIYMILEKTREWEQVSFWIDPISSQQAQGPTSLTIQKEFEAGGIPTSCPKGYSKASGINHVKNFLKPDRSQPHPFLDDKFDSETERFALGRPSILYIDGACPANIAEKSVYRYAVAKAREAKEGEIGLSPMINEKIMDRDDHAQTAEMFAFLGEYPIDKKAIKKLQERTLVQPTINYDGGKKRGRI